MGEAKRKRMLAARAAAEWRPLFSDDSPVRVAISRPTSRTVSTRTAEQNYAEGIGARLAAGKPILCINTECDSEMRKLPDVFAFLLASDKPGTPAICMSVCPKCAGKSDDELMAMMRKDFHRYGIDEASTTPHLRIQLECEVAHWLEPIDGLMIAVAGQPDDPLCDVAKAFYCMIRDGKLMRFLAFRDGLHNCHALVGQLYLDLLDINAVDLFDFKRGSSALLKSEADPNGLHSWIEADGWVIETTGTSLGNPILIQRAEEYYSQRQLSDIRDVRHEIEGQEDAA